MIKNFLNKIYLAILSSLGGILGALGGADNSSKAYRRFVIPAMITGWAYGRLESIFVLTIMFMSFPLAMGYGLPGANDPKPSKLGKFFYDLFKGNRFLANLTTRGTIGLTIAITLLSVPIIKGNWITYGLGSLGIILVNALISWRNLGTYKLFGKELLWVETITWGLITFLCSLIIYLK